MLPPIVSLMLRPILPESMNGDLVSSSRFYSSSHSILTRNVGADGHGMRSHRVLQRGQVDRLCTLHRVVLYSMTPFRLHMSVGEGGGTGVVSGFIMNNAY